MNFPCNFLVEAIIKRCKKDQLIHLYKIPNFETVSEFLIHMAHKTGKLGKVNSWAILLT